MCRALGLKPLRSGRTKSVNVSRSLDAGPPSAGWRSSLFYLGIFNAQYSEAIVFKLELLSAKKSAARSISDRRRVVVRLD